jgi:hypothetical protein
MFAFLLLLFVLLVIYSFTTATKEGFNPMNTSPSHQVNIPVNQIPSMLPSPPAAKVSNTVSTLSQNGSIFSNCSVEPSTLPGQLPQAPYQQIAAASPLPYQDTTLIKANRQQLINLLELLKGFLAFEAQEIAERSDPTIQLPLQTARSDFHTLQSEVEVLNRNPGIQPNMTLSHLNEISSNLAFLQQKVRLIGAAGPIQGPIYQFTKPVEGFKSKGKKLAKKAMSSSNKLTNSASDEVTAKIMKRIDPAKLKAGAARIDKAKSTGVGLEEAVTDFGILVQSVATPEEFEILSGGAAMISEFEQLSEADKKAFNDTVLADVKAANSAAPSVVPGKSAKSSPAMIEKDTTTGNATLNDLKKFIERIDVESMRLSASGDTSETTSARIVALAEIKSDIQTILTQIQRGSISESEIPVTKELLNKALPILGKPSDPLPQLIKKAGLPPALANLLPSNMLKDPETTREINQLIDKYMDTIVNGVSASFEVKYTSPFEAMKGYGAMMQSSVDKSEFPSMNQSIIDKSGFSSMNPSIIDKSGFPSMNPSMMNQSTIDKTGFPSMSDLDNISNAKFTPMDSGMPVTDRMAPTPMDAGRGPSHFDWKERSKQIEQQVKKRGLDPSDFGIMPPQTKVSKDFSWKGYARMICTRLQATMDPSLPVTCGCPPLDWSGWRIAK